MSSLSSLVVSFVLCLLNSAQAQVAPRLSNSCGVCEYGQPGYYGGWWTTADVASTTSIEAVTLVVVTGADGVSSTSTVFNFPPGAAVPATNSAGYPVYAKTLSYGPSTITTTLTWPTGYVSYQSGASWSGTIPASAGSGSSNTTACSTARAGALSLYDSAISPIFPTPVSSAVDGPVFPTTYPGNWWQWTFYDDGQPDASCFAVYNTSVFTNYASALPSFPVYNYCLAPSELVCAPVALQTAAYLTVTSHRPWSGDGPQTTRAHDSTRHWTSAEAEITTPSTRAATPATGAQAAPIAATTGAVTTTQTVTQTVSDDAAAASSEEDPAQITSTATSTVGAAAGNPHDSRSVIRTSPFTVAHGASHRVQASAVVLVCAALAPLLLLGVLR